MRERWLEDVKKVAIRRVRVYDGEIKGLPVWRAPAKDNLMALEIVRERTRWALDRPNLRPPAQLPQRGVCLRNCLRFPKLAGSGRLMLLSHDFATALIAHRG